MLKQKQTSILVSKCIVTSGSTKSYLKSSTGKSNETKTVLDDAATRAQFIFKLHTMVGTEDANIVTWIKDGSAFLIKQPEMFAKHLLPKYCGHKTFTSFERQMNFYRFERMGENETKSSRKRFRRGSAIKYCHKNFTRDSTSDQLTSIKRRTCPSKERIHLSNLVKEARQKEMDYLLQHKRLLNIITALNTEIGDREKYHQANQNQNKKRKVQKNHTFVPRTIIIDDHIEGLDDIEPIDFNTMESMLDDVGLSVNTACYQIEGKTENMEDDEFTTFLLDL